MKGTAGMPIIGYCHDCQLWVRVGPGLECPSGHPAEHVNGWYDEETGAAVVPEGAAEHGATISPDVAAPPAAHRKDFLADLMLTLSQNHAYCAALGPDADITIVSNPVDPTWGAGDRKAEYGAALKAVEADRLVYFWEHLEERSDDVSLALESGIYDTPVTKRSGTKHGTGIGPGSTSWEWGYGTLARVVEEAALRHGFHVRVVLTRPAASW